MATKKQNNKQLNIKNNLHIIHPTSFFWANGPHTLNQPFVLSFTPYGTSEESCNKHCNKPSWRSEDTWWVWVWQDGAVQSATSRQIGWEGPNAKRLGILKTWSSTGCCCFADPFLLEQFAIMSNIVLNIQFDFPVWFYLQVKKTLGLNKCSIKESAPLSTGITYMFVPFFGHKTQIRTTVESYFPEGIHPPLLLTDGRRLGVDGWT